MENVGTEEAAAEKSESVIPEETLDYTVEAADMGRADWSSRSRDPGPELIWRLVWSSSTKIIRQKNQRRMLREEAHEDVQEYIREEIQQDPSAERAEEPDYEELPEERLPSQQSSKQNRQLP